MSIRQLTELRRDYVPWDREYGARAFAKRFGCSVQQIHYWTAPESQRDKYRKWRRRASQATKAEVNSSGLSTVQAVETPVVRRATHERKAKG